MHWRGTSPSSIRDGARFETAPPDPGLDPKGAARAAAVLRGLRGAARHAPPALPEKRAGPRKTQSSSRSPGLTLEMRVAQLPSGPRVLPQVPNGDAAVDTL